jgi:hypothetical protein
VGKFDNASNDEDSDSDAIIVRSSMERYDVSSGQWSAAAAMGTARHSFGACVVAGELYVSGRDDTDDNPLSCVEKYSPLSGT